eukprot:4606296-Pleurochrysis_carterae.AAC.2
MPTAARECAIRAHARECANTRECECCAGWREHQRDARKHAWGYASNARAQACARARAHGGARLCWWV